MKKLSLIKVLSLLALAIVSAGCHESDVIWDFANISFRVWVNDADGNNLLDPDFDGNILDKDISFTLDGKTEAAEIFNYKDWINSFEPESRYNMPRWYGAKIMIDFPEDNPLPPFITIGEFDGARNADTSFTLDIAGEKYTLGYYNNVKIKGDDAKVVRRFYLNGEYVGEKPQFTIVLP